MDYFYEVVRSKEFLPISIFIHGVNKFKMHIHKEIEIILVLQGSINIRVGPVQYVLKENDFIVINSYEVHNTWRTKEDNICIAFQVDIDYYDKYYPGFNRRVFNCKSFTCEEDEKGKYDKVRQYLAKIAWEMKRKKEGYGFTVGSEVLSLANYLINNFDNYIMEDKSIESINKNIYILNSIIKYIDENLEGGVTLKEVACNENLSIYYLSHFIKKTMGISFQEYINLKRLDKAINFLINTDKSITKIAFQSGFPSTKSLNIMFNKIYGYSPSQYRKKNSTIDEKTKDLGVDKEKLRSKTYLDVDRNAAFSKLFKYLNADGEKYNVGNSYTSQKQIITININKKGIYHDYYWKNLTTFGRAAEGLRKEWQNQLEELQREIGFKYIRFHGIFSDEMMVLNFNDEGNIVYNWSYVDELFDFFKKVNIKPFIELGFMPTEIRKSNETMFWWKANVSQPRDIGLWTNLVREFIKHCINRYGLQEVKTWYFEVWNEPELEYVYWIGEKEDYFKFYKETVLAIKSISHELKVGGPSITHQALKDGVWLEDFLIYLNDNKVPLDFVSLHIYPENFSSNEEMQSLMEKLKQGISLADLIMDLQGVKRVYFCKNHTYDTLISANNKIKGLLPYSPEIHITEWNTSASGRNPISDTSFVATFIIRNVLQSIGQVNSLGYWTFTDIMEEMKAGISHFHGGFGLINKEGLKKPSYFAYYLLSKLGAEIIEQGEEYIVTKNDDDIQIMLYNFAYFDELFMRGDTSLLTNRERYLVYENKEPKDIEINIKGISGHYKVKKYQLDREHGSVFDQWVRMGTPENMTEEEINFLKGRSYPKMTIEYVNIDGKYTTNSYVPVHGVELIILKKQI